MEKYHEKYHLGVRVPSLLSDPLIIEPRPGSFVRMLHAKLSSN